MKIQLLFFIMSLSSILNAQMWNGQDTLYGNEWINFEQSYFKINVSEDGIYRVSGNTLQNAGIDISQINHQNFQLFHLGVEQPISVSALASTLSNDDFIEFYGEKNRSELDQYLFKSPEAEMLNPYYSMITDTAAYFLTWKDGVEGMRYEEVENNLVGLPEAEVWYWGEEVKEMHQKNIYQEYANYIKQSIFEEGEGYGSSYSSNLSTNLDMNGYINGITEAAIKLQFVSTYSIHQHELEVSINGEVYDEEQFNGVDLKQLDFTLSNSLPSSTTVQIKGLGTTNDRYSMGYIKLKYPRDFNFQGNESQSFVLDGLTERKYIAIEAFISDEGQSILYDLDDGTRTEGIYEDNLLKFSLPNSTIDKHHFFLSKSEAIHSIATLTPINFIDYENTNADYIILSHPDLYDDGNGNDYVQQYADFRSSTEGGSHQVVVIDIDELYQQFAYGINRHPLSIRNFGHFVKKNWTNAHYMFILGKGRTFEDMRTQEQLNEVLANGFFVPTFGTPGTDNLLLSTNEFSVPVLSIGRIPATTPNEIRIYLNKVRTHEGIDVNTIPQTVEEKRWMKNIIHLGGGGTTGEQQIIKSHLGQLEAIIEQPKFGADVFNFYKSSTEHVQTTTNDLIFQKINEGSSIITFFGHSAPGTFDFNIDNPENYSNFGKLPLLISLGCYSGNIHLQGKSIGERFVFYEGKGALAFAGSSGQGYIDALKTYAAEFYELIGDEMYGQSIGDVFNKASDNLKTNGFSVQLLLQQFNLIGDPALQLHPLPGPDFVIDRNSVSFSPKVINAQIDSIELTFDVVNIGTAIQDSIDITIDQQLPDGTKIHLKTVRIDAPYNHQILVVNLPNQGKKAVGLNTFLLEVDAANEVEELPNPGAEFNNKLSDFSGSPGIPVFVIDNSARAVFPPEFGIVSSPEVTLKASSTNALAPERTYLMEIDTTALFDSPNKRSTSITQKGGVIKWHPDIVWQDSMVYYWRISPDSIISEVGYDWDNSSFTYIPDSPNGWSQGHYWQWLEGGGDMGIDTNRIFNFSQKLTTFRLKNKINETNNTAQGYINNAAWSDFFRWNIPQSLTVVVFSPKSLNDIYRTQYSNLWFNFNPGEYGSTNTNAARIASFPFKMDTQENRNNFINFINNVIPEDAIVFIYTALSSPTQDLFISEWASDSINLSGKNIFNTLESYGANQIRDLDYLGVTPYILGFQKGGGLIYEYRALDSSEVINFEYNVPAFLFNGNYISTKIGPSSTWNKLILNQEIEEPSDSTYVNIYGYHINGTIDSLTGSNSPSEIDLSFIDAQTYPYIYLKYFSQDETNFTPTQLKRWTVLYSGLPEVAVSPNLHYEFQKDSLQQGEPGFLAYKVENIGAYPVDSLSIKYTITDDNNNALVYFGKTPPLHPDDLFTDTFNFDTLLVSGQQNLTVEVNPENNPLEVFHFNNYIQQPFTVNKDTRNPLLDVTFDGQHILNDEIVRPQVEISISLKDENQYLLLSDTSLFYIAIADSSHVEKIISFTDFEAGSEANQNEARGTIHPNFTKDGYYTLRIKAKDAAGNRSGNIDFIQSFQVISKRTISNVLNYPNPFSTNTYFVYTLTGDAPPEQFRILIYTVSGRLVKELTQYDLGELKIGTHKTTYAWDGTDQFGDQLANGVYLYKVTTKDSSGKAFEIYETDVDSFFDKGFGKLVILR